MSAGDYDNVATQISMNTYEAKQPKEEEMKLMKHADGFQGGSNGEKKEKQHHYLIVTVKRANLNRFASSLPMMGVFDPYCQVLLGDNTDNVVSTSKVYACSNGRPRWNFTRRFDYNEIADIPKTLKFTVLDADVFSEDDEIGHYTLDCEKIKLFDIKPEQNEDAQSVQFTKEVKLLNTDNKETNNTLKFSIDYHCVSLSSLKTRMRRQRENCLKNAHLSRVAIEWIDLNKELFLLLKSNKDRNIRITWNDFDDMLAPPYNLIRNNYAKFLESFAKLQKYYELDENGNGYQAYYDPEFKVLYYDLHYNKNFGGINVTNQIKLMWRYIFLKDILLKGQDSEFNIYRSFYFEPKPVKMAMALLALVVQLVLTTAVTIDVVENWEGTFEDINWFIFACSFMVFCFLSFSINSTVELFAKFYENINLAYNIPWFLLICDFMSNVGCSIYVCVLSFFFLLQSTTYSDLVLNSFALTFLVDIDDMVNVFDKDEDFVIIQDLRAFAKAGYDTPREIHYKPADFLRLLYAPFGLVMSIKEMIRQIYKLCCCRRHKKLSFHNFKYNVRQQTTDE